MTLQHRVNKGVAYLDQRYLRWWSLIDVECLHMGNMRRCIGGQLCGNYDIFMEKCWEFYNPKPAASYEEMQRLGRQLGFALKPLRINYYYAKYDELTKVWTNKIYEYQESRGQHNVR